MVANLSVNCYAIGGMLTQEKRATERVAHINNDEERVVIGGLPFYKF